jgi:hypothetical protein
MNNNDFIKVPRDRKSWGLKWAAFDGRWYSIKSYENLPRDIRIWAI